MQACKVCYSSTSHCYNSGTSGSGIPNADFALYVSFTSSDNCGESTLAYASYCALEPNLDRYVHTYNIYNYMQQCMCMLRMITVNDLARLPLRCHCT